MKTKHEYWKQSLMVLESARTVTHVLYVLGIDKKRKQLSIAYLTILPHCFELREAEITGRRMWLVNHTWNLKGVIT